LVHDVFKFIILVSFILIEITFALSKNKNNISQLANVIHLINLTILRTKINSLQLVRQSLNTCSISQHIQTSGFLELGLGAIIFDLMHTILVKLLNSPGAIEQGKSRIFHHYSSVKYIFVYLTVAPFQVEAWNFEKVKLEQGIAAICEVSRDQVTLEPFVESTGFSRSEVVPWLVLVCIIDDGVVRVVTIICMSEGD